MHETMNHDMKLAVLSLLQASRLLLDDKTNWTTGYAARIAHDACPVDPASPDARCWCAVGAPQAFLPEWPMREPAYPWVLTLLNDEAIKRGAKSTGSDFGSTHALNDKRGHRAVLECYDAVIEQVCQSIDDDGWGLFDFDGTGLMKIQRDDELDYFAGDDEALAYVQARAAEGSAKHIEALQAHERDAAQLAVLRTT